MENEVVQLYLDDIIPNRFQPREVFDDQALKELAVSIREHGVIQPILVRKFGEKYEIIAGERRYKASTMAGLTKIPAIVKNLDDKESSKVALIENLQRRDLTPIEEARTYQKILDLDEMTQEQLAKTMGKSQSAVSNKLRLLSLPDEIQESLLKEEISERHARSLLNIADKNVQVDLLKEIVNNKMTVRELDSKIKSLNGENSDNSTTDTEVSGGTTNDLFNQENVVPVENTAETTIETMTSPNDLFTTSVSVEATNTEVVPTEVQNESSLFGTSSSEPVQNAATDALNSLFGTSAPVEEAKPEVVSNDLGVENMNNDNLFGNNMAEPVNNDISQTTNLVEENNNDTNLFNDPTVVDIDKVREQSSDINFNINNNSFSNIETATNNTDALLGKNDDSSNRFIPNFEETMIEKTEDGNEVIGNGLLAGMPVIKPIDENEAMNNNGNNVDNNVINNDMNSLFGTSAPTPVETTGPDLNSLFGNNMVEPTPVENNQSLNDLFGSNQNAVNTDSIISTNNVQVIVEEVKNNIKTYQDKGYKVTIEELDLDQEIQLIVKFNKN